MQLNHYFLKLILLKVYPFITILIEIRLLIHFIIMQLILIPYLFFTIFDINMLELMRESKHGESQVILKRSTMLVGLIR